MNKRELQELINHRQYLHLRVLDLPFLDFVCHLLYGLYLLLNRIHDLASVELKQSFIERQSLLEQRTLAHPLILLIALKIPCNCNQLLLNSCNALNSCAFKVKQSIDCLIEIIRQILGPNEKLVNYLLDVVCLDHPINN